MSEIALLKSKISSLKSKLTRLQNYFNSINKNELDDIIINQLESRLEKIQPIWEQFDEIQFEIEQMLCTSENPESQSDKDERDAFENSYFKLTGDIKILIKNYNQTIERNDGSVVSFRHNSVVSNSVQSLVKLQSIKLPTFDGQYGNWLEFKDSFVALVDSNPTLNSIQKFYYLRSSLSAEVLEIIKSIEVSSSNYTVAWQFLADRFANKKLIIYNHIRAIFEHPSLLKESYTDLRNLYDSVTKHLRALKALGETTHTWDRLVIYIMCSKFASTTQRDWEINKYESDLPTMKDLSNYLQLKCEMLENLEMSNKDANKNNKQNKKYFRDTSNNYHSTNKQDNNKFKCYYCQQSHGIFNCSDFLKLSVNERIAAVKRIKLCLNCLHDLNCLRELRTITHPSWKCNKSKCFKCKRSHNTLLHSDSYHKMDQNSEATAGANSLPPTERENDTTPNTADRHISLNSYVSEAEGAVAVLNPFSSCAQISAGYSQVLLSTAMIQLTNGKKSIMARALLDSGSQSNFISENICKKLNLQRTAINHAVKGVGQTFTNINDQVNVTIKSCISNFKTDATCLILEYITDKLPIMSFNKDVLKIPANISLADPKFNTSNIIEVLLGSSIFWSIMGSNQVQLGPNMPILQETKFGYIIAGNLCMNPTYSLKVSVNCLNILDSDTSIDNKIIKFWELEDISSKEPNMSDSEKYCERYFKETVQRDASGRFIVKIPFKNNIEQLGDSRDMALKRFYHLERKFKNNPELKSDYVKFMSEYESLGHMCDDVVDDGYYLPHHAVIKNCSITTKCRVVFDASAKSSSGFSLNNVQYVGPTNQQDVFSILTRFRIHEFVLTGDISKMYRQVLIDSNETKFQKIFWRSQSDEKINVYKLNTVTYGTASAPYLGVRCLFQIADENENKFPIVSNIIKRDFYMDDVLTGSDSIEELLQIQKDLVNLLSSYGFELR
ncbi:uncharacterized protein LOC115883521 [Sitophilus oryzae]|uniref:Uncharacterized protein LOC115883521 n=1 Tax=Sitophilus oryzae TaxID=7048 RepID=A0A6J2Y3B0_SITOR|nr:uncharacterized protein LOC115883521 [Sitophilus oryzae]